MHIKLFGRLAIIRDERGLVLLVDSWLGEVVFLSLVGGISCFTLGEISEIGWGYRSEQPYEFC